MGGGRPGGLSQCGEKAVIKVYENFRAVFYTPFYLAHALGAYEAEGLDVLMATAPTPAGSVRALLQGKVEAAWGGPMRVLHHYDQDPECGLVCFCEVVTRDPFYLVGRKPKPGEFRLTGLHEYKLATVSEVPTPWLCLQETLRREGADPEGLERVTDRTMAENADALRAGDLDVIQVFEPYVELLVGEGAGHVWYEAAKGGRTAYTSFYTTRANLAAHGPAFLGMTRAMYRTMRWIASRGAPEVAEAVEEFFPDILPEVLSGAIGRYMKNGVWGEDPVLSKEGFQRLKSGLLSGGFISLDVAYEDCVSTRFANQVVQENPPPL